MSARSIGWPRPQKFLRFSFDIQYTCTRIYGNCALEIHRCIECDSIASYFYYSQRTSPNWELARRIVFLFFIIIFKQNKFNFLCVGWFRRIFVLSPFIISLNIPTVPRKSYVWSVAFMRDVLVVRATHRNKSREFLNIGRRNENNEKVQRMKNNKKKKTIINK